MTPQQLKAMKLALEALEDIFGKNKVDVTVINVIKEVLAEHAMKETQRLGQEIEQEPKIGCVNHDCDQCKAQPERHELQAKGEHPAPCARHCEANAFQIVIKNLKAQLAQPVQEPVVDDIASILACRDMLDAQPVPPRTWVGLTDEERKDIELGIEVFGTSVEDILKEAEAKLKQKNGYVEEKNT